MNNGTVITELRRIEAKHGGVLRPKDVVKEAQKKSNPLHSWFEWDDSAAGRQYRLWQARHLILVSVEVLPQTDQSTRVFVSLKGDRIQPGGGYRNIVSVLSDEETRGQLLEEALAEFKAFERKYKMLKQLAPIFAAAKQIKRGKMRKVS